MSLILIPITLAVVVGTAPSARPAEKLSRLGVPRVTVAIIPSSARCAGHLLRRQLAFRAFDDADQPSSGVHRKDDQPASCPIWSRYAGCAFTPASLQSGPISINALLENTGNVLHVVTTNLTPALVQALIFFAALLLSLSGRVNLRKTIILTFRTRPEQRLHRPSASSAPSSRCCAFISQPPRSSMRRSASSWR